MNSSLSFVPRHIGTASTPPKYLNNNDLLNYPVVLESEICKYIPEIMRDFGYIGVFNWCCVQWPSIRHITNECLIMDDMGTLYTTNDIITKYTNDNDTEVTTTDDGETYEHTYY